MSDVIHCDDAVRKVRERGLGGSHLPDNTGLRWRVDGLGARAGKRQVRRWVDEEKREMRRKKRQMKERLRR